MTLNQGKIAFVLTGGGSLGAVQVGMLRALLASGVRPDFVVGASVGAINASYFACLPTAEGIANLEKIWTGLRRSDIFPFTLASIIGLLRHPGNLVDPGGLRRIIEANLPCARLQDTQIPLTIMATNLQGTGIRLSTGSAVDAILASTAIPGIFPPVEISGEPLMDGAVAANTPMRLAAELGASRIIILPTGYACSHHHDHGLWRCGHETKGTGKWCRGTVHQADRLRGAAQRDRHAGPTNRLTS